MKKNIFKKVSSVLALSLTLALSLASCTDKYDEYNVNPHEATNEMMTRDNLLAGASLAQMERSIFTISSAGRYQETEMLQGDLFASYFAPIMTWAYTGGADNDNYRLYTDWNKAPWDDAYTDIMTPWNIIRLVTRMLAKATHPPLLLLQ